MVEAFHLELLVAASILVDFLEVAVGLALADFLALMEEIGPPDLALLLPTIGLTDPVLVATIGPRTDLTMA